MVIFILKQTSNDIHNIKLWALVILTIPFPQLKPNCQRNRRPQVRLFFKPIQGGNLFSKDWKCCRCLISTTLIKVLKLVS